jgi:hypothetical protein
MGLLVAMFTAISLVGAQLFNNNAEFPEFWRAREIMIIMIIAQIIVCSGQSNRKIICFIVQRLMVC